jgi:hypothetical protein
MIGSSPSLVLQGHLDPKLGFLPYFSIHVLISSCVASGRFRNVSCFVTLESTFRLDFTPCGLLFGTVLLSHFQTFFDLIFSFVVYL